MPTGSKISKLVRYLKLNKIEFLFQNPAAGQSLVSDIPAKEAVRGIT